MIDKLRIKNFQSHKDTEIEFDSGINVITGPSDVGKSAVIRSMQWVVDNRPAGDNIRRHGTKETTVEMKGVVKKRSKSKHYYEMEGMTFKALRSDVPVEVQQAVNMTSINFQGQHEAYFLIGDSPGQVARILNEVADLKIIDDSLKAVKKKVKEAKTRKVILKEQLEGVQNYIEDLAWVPFAVKLQNQIENKETEIKTLESSVTEITDHLKLCEERIEELTSIPDMTEDVKSTILTQGKLDFSGLDELGIAISNVNDLQIDYPDCGFDIDSITEVDLTKNPMIERLNQSVQDVQRLKDSVSRFPSYFDDVDPGHVNDISFQYRELEFALDEVISCKGEVSVAQKNFDFKKSQYDKRVKEIGACPLCGGVI